jgi:Zn-dependent protease with chaperone function
MRRLEPAVMFISTAYRDPSEYPILVTTILLVIMVIILTAAATLCGSFLFVVLVLLVSYQATLAHHQDLVRQARKITQQDSPQLSQRIQVCTQRLQVEPVEIFVIPASTLNAYTFGLSSPKAIVLYQPLFKIMDENELQFIIGHEMGHIRLGHTWLNSLVGGMAGIPAAAPATLLLVLAFRWWNRACEYSSDRAGLLACGSLTSAIKALIKIEAGSEGYLRNLSNEDLGRALQRLESQDDNMMNSFSEFFATHPMIINRLGKLREFSRTDTYIMLQEKMNSNLMK